MRNSVLDNFGRSCWSVNFPKSNEEQDRAANCSQWGNTRQWMFSIGTCKPTKGSSLMKCSLALEVMYTASSCGEIQSLTDLLSYDWIAFFCCTVMIHATEFNKTLHLGDFTVNFITKLLIPHCWMQLGN